MGWYSENIAPTYTSEVQYTDRRLCLYWEIQNIDALVCQIVVKKK